MAQRIRSGRTWGERLASTGALAALVCLVACTLYLAHNEQKKSSVIESTATAQSSIRQAESLLDSQMRYLSLRLWEKQPRTYVLQRLDAVDSLLHETQEGLWYTAKALDISGDQESMGFTFHLAGAIGRMTVAARRVVTSSPSNSTRMLRDAGGERLAAAMELNRAESKITEGMRKSLQVLMASTHRGYGGIVFSLAALIACISVPLALRFHRMYGVMAQDQEELKKAYEEILQNKCDLQAKAVELEDAVAESQAQSSLFEHASNRFQQLFGGLPVGCMTVDVNGTIQEWNAAMSELTGIDGHLACYQHASAVFPAFSSNPDFDEIIREVIEFGSKKEFEWEHRSLGSGKVLHAFYTAYPLRNPKGVVLGAIVAGFNITERKAAERSLAESEQRFDTATRASSTGIFEWYVTENRQYWSPRIHEIFGTDERTFQPGSFAISDRFVPGDREQLLHMVDLHTAGMEPLFSMEGRIQRETGEIRYIHIRGQAARNKDGEAVRVTGAIDDITDRKQAEKALADSERRFRDVTEAAGEFVFELDQDGSFSFITDRVETILGWTPDELIGKPAWHIIQPELQDQAKALQRLVYSRRRWPGNSVALAWRKSGAACQLQITALAIYAEDGSFRGFRGTAMDITAQKLAEAELAKAHQMLNDTLQSIRDGFFSVDEQWQFVFANQTAHEFFGSSQLLQGRPVWDDLPESLRERFHWAASLAIEEGEEKAFEVVVPEKHKWFEFRIYPRQSGASVFFQDISDRKHFEEQIEAQMLEINEKNSILQMQQRSLEDANRRLAAMATTDGLTALKNHKAFQAALSELFEESAGLDSPISLILLDVDNFKRYNDTFGHPAGDDVLRMVAHILKQQGRRGDIVARYGGEEFVMVLPNTRAQDALTAAERVRNAIADHSWPNTSVTASLGVSSTTAGAATRQDLVSQADTALYQSKAAGRNCTTLWQAKSQLKVAERGKHAA